MRGNPRRDARDLRLDGVAALHQHGHELRAFAGARGRKLGERLVRRAGGHARRARPGRRSARPARRASGGSRRPTAAARPGRALATSEAAFASSPTRARSTARLAASAAERDSEMRHSTLPRFNSPRICSRSVASSPRNSSGRRTWRSRKRWLTERSSTASATPGSSAATAAKPVMLRIIAETRRIQATFPTLLWALSSGECMRYPLQAQARDLPVGMRIASEFRG